MAEYPWVQGQASGMAVGLPEGQMGNSEVGHMNMACRTYCVPGADPDHQSRFSDGDFFNYSEALLTAVRKLQKKKRTCPAPVSACALTGGVHSHITHLYGLLAAGKAGMAWRRYMYTASWTAVTHRRTSGKGFVTELWKTKMAELGAGKVATCYGPLLCHGS